MRCALGIDFGTNSVRAVIVDLAGDQLACAVCAYPSGEEGVILSDTDPRLARQNPADYHACLVRVVKEAVSRAKKRRGFSAASIIGIGVDTTGSTPIPVDERLVPLSFRREFQGNLNALAWLWKDHTATAEAEEITETARRIRPQYLSRIGGVYSSEWFFSKILRLARADRKVFDRAASFVEFADYIPALLTGVSSPSGVVRNICAAGHKALYDERWNGLPDDEFLETLSPAFKGLRKRLYERAYPAGTRVGGLCHEWAKLLGLPEGIAVSAGAFDAHMGAVGAGVRPGVLVKILGTSSCDMTVAPKEARLPDIPGVCGIVPDSIVPNFYGIEAGQSAVGDIFSWFLKRFLPRRSADPFRAYQQRAARMKPGQSGLLCLDWHNGNRCVLVDQKLTGATFGLTLSTRPEEMYRALIEATGFGARVIIERMEEYGVSIDTLVAAGGIAEKNPLLLQIYADITGREIRLSASPQTCALGAALFGAVAAGGYASVEEGQRRLCRFKRTVYRPVEHHRRVYQRLYHLYRQVHDAFGTQSPPASLCSVMKELLAIQEEASR